MNGPSGSATGAGQTAWPVLVTRMTASVGCSMRGPGTSLPRMSRPVPAASLPHPGLPRPGVAGVVPEGGRRARATYSSKLRLLAGDQHDPPVRQGRGAHVHVVAVLHPDEPFQCSRPSGELEDQGCGAAGGSAPRGDHGAPVAR